jgi:hypothetical protein
VYAPDLVYQQIYTERTLLDALDAGDLQVSVPEKFDVQVGMKDVLTRRNYNRRGWKRSRRKYGWTRDVFGALFICSFFRFRFQFIFFFGRSCSGRRREAFRPVETGIVMEKRRPNYHGDLVIKMSRVVPSFCRRCLFIFLFTLLVFFVFVSTFPPLFLVFLLFGVSCFIVQCLAFVRTVALTRRRVCVFHG